MDLQHPTVTRMRRTGYPKIRVEIERTFECEQCKRELSGHVISHKDGHFCNETCLGEHLAENEEFEEVIV